MEFETETEVGKFDSDGNKPCQKEILYHPDGRLKLKAEMDWVESQSYLIHDTNLLLSSFGKVEETTSVEIRRKLLSKAKRRLVEFQELKCRKEEMMKEKRSARNSRGEEEDIVVQELLYYIKEVSVMDQKLVEFTTKVDLAMGNSKEGHAKEVDLVLENSKEGLKGDMSRKGKEAKKARKIQKGLAKYEEWRRKKDEEERNRDPEELTDRYAYEARLFEKNWNMIYPTGFGRFEDNTSIPCKRYTFNPAPHGGFKRDTLQVFSVKVTKLTGGLQWPINVFGMVALRDSLDRNRNVIFKRERDNCQTLTDENPCLLLTGPVRGVVFNDPVVLEVLLYVRGTAESDDKELSLLAADLIKTCTRPHNSLLIERSYTSRLSTLVFELGIIVFSVEATISVKVISGPPDGFYGEFVAFTDTLKREILLHNSGVELHLAGDEINLSRSVVSVECFGKLMVSVRASDGSITLTGTKEFKALEKDTTTRVLHIPELCQLEITVAWSLFSYWKT